MRWIYWWTMLDMLLELTFSFECSVTVDGYSNIYMIVFLFLCHKAWYCHWIKSLPPQTPNNNFGNIRCQLLWVAYQFFFFRKVVCCAFCSQVADLRYICNYNLFQIILPRYLGKTSNTVMREVETNTFSFSEKKFFLTIYVPCFGVCFSS